ncbi:MAG: toll/interleukin-1 receptor domain-containing protein, partial [Mycobacterium sp.]
MSDATQALQPPAATPVKPAEYDAFLSYTHADRPVAGGVQKGLHQIGRRLGQLRALRVFRDDTNLEVAPDLWGKITEAMDRARYLVVVLSPLAAQSFWVNKEVSYWLAHRGRDQLLLVLAGGQLVWDGGRQGFDPRTSNAALPVLCEPGVLPTDPFFIDVSADAPWDAHAAPLREKITALAAPIHGKPKDQLAGDDLREQRRFRRLRAAAVSGLVVLAVVAIVAALIAVVQRQEAIRQRDQATAERLDAEAQSMLAGARSGGDIRAFQELVAAAPAAPDKSALLHAVAQRSTTAKVLDTGAEVPSVALSPDGHRVATAEAVAGRNEGTVRLWDANTGQPIGAPLTGHTNKVTSVAFSPDGHRLASGSWDNTVRLWDVDTGRPIGAPLTGHQDFIESVAFSPDGHRLASGSWDHTVRIWDADNGQPIGAPLTGYTGKVDSVAFSPDGHLLATGSDDGLLALWNADVWKLMGMLQAGQKGGMLRVVFSSDGRRMASASMDGAVRQWDTATGAPIGDPLNHVGAVFGVAYSPDGHRLASVGSDATVRLWDADTSQPIGAPLKGHTDASISVAFSPDGRRLASSSRDRSLRIWDLDPIFAGYAYELEGVAFSPDGHRLASAGAD